MSRTCSNDDWQGSCVFQSIDGGIPALLAASSSPLSSASLQLLLLLLLL